MENEIEKIKSTEKSFKEFSEEQKKLKIEKQEELEELTREKEEEWKNAESEEIEIRKKIDEILETTDDKKEAESIIVKKYGADYQKAMKNTRLIFIEYLNALAKSNPKLTEYSLAKQDYKTLGATDLIEKAVEKRKKLLGDE